MDESTFLELLKRSESDTLDFKATQYDFSGVDKPAEDRKRALFVKDVLCMKNTPREEPAYIVLGVKNNADSSKELVGLNQHHDDADLQSKLHTWVFPHPKFRYSVVKHGGKDFGVISVPADRTIGPCLPLKEFPGGLLRERKIYFRRNSQNAEADYEEQKQIYKWFEGSRILNPVTEGADPAWDSFIRAVDNFNPRRAYVLALNHIDVIPALANLGCPAWSFVADFDPKSQALGALNAARPVIERHRGLHLMTKDDRATFNPTRSTYWYFARGIEGRDSTLATGRWIEWQRSFLRDIRYQIATLAKAASVPTTVVAIWNNGDLLEQLNSFFEATVEAYGESVNFVIVSENCDVVASLASKYEAKCIQIRLEQFLHGMASYCGEDRQSDTVSLPSASGAKIHVDEKDRAWLLEEVEVVHSGSGQAPSADASPGKDFLRGQEISWFELGLHLDVQRDIAPKVVSAVRRDLQKRQTTRINLYHAPGSGGTTLGRRICWDFKEEYPCLVLRRTSPRETVERIAKVFALTEQPVLIQFEGSEVNDREMDELYDLLASRNIPSVMLHVSRRLELPRLADRSFYLEQRLSDLEAEKFAYLLKREVPGHAREIEVAVRESQGAERTPFYLGLVCFEREFAPLEPFVERHLGATNEIQKKVLLYIAVAHYYGQRPLPVQSFCELLKLPANKVVDLRNALPVWCFALLAEVTTGKWRTAHYLVAEEIIRSLLSTGSTDRRLWVNRLADLAVEFADFCETNLPEQSQETLQLIQRVFLYRDESEILGTERSAGRHFAQILTDIPIAEGRLRVLKHLVDIFPTEAHFWAHLGRFYAMELKDFDNAVLALERAISIDDDDHVLYHMRGMAFRSWAYDLIARRSEVNEVVEKAKLASESFARARQLDAEDDHGYISEVQMITRIIDYCGKASETEALVAASRSSDPWVRESTQVAEDLLLTVRQQRQGQQPSEYEERCRADLDALYGQHEKALQIWDSLLTRMKGKIFAPPIRRQIVWTYLSRRNRDWDSVTPKEVERIVTLLEDNLQEEAHDDRNVRLWVQAIRQLTNPPDIETVIEKVAYWRANSNSLEAIYYLYVLYALQAIGGSVLAADKAERVVEECRNRARYRRDRTRSFEWVGQKQGLRQLVHQDRLGGWNPNVGFWENTSVLKRISGVIVQMSGPQAGLIEIMGGLRAFFVPAASGHSIGRSENQTITCYVGFSYDGLRAWSVENA